MTLLLKTINGELKTLMKNDIRLGAIGDIDAMTWPGQFNLDFMYMLTLSGIWVSWRHHFSASGLGLGLLALFGGSLFLSAYLLIVSLQAKGNINELLLGKVWAA